jgi:RNA:NAD 2'-phosphotransferase (TPT1/KptA family)
MTTTLIMLTQDTGCEASHSCGIDNKYAISELERTTVSRILSWVLRFRRRHLDLSQQFIRRRFWTPFHLLI